MTEKGSCDKITDTCHVGSAHMFSWVSYFLHLLRASAVPPLTLLHVLLHWDKPHHREAWLHWWVGQSDNMQGGALSSQTLKESLKLWFMLPCVVVSCLFFRRSVSRSGMEISIKIPDYRSTQPTSWHTAELHFVALAVLNTAAPLLSSSGIKWLFFT